MSAPEPKSPNVQKLPRLSEQIKDEISKVSKELKHAEMTVKDNIPTKEDVENERNHERMKADIQNFDETKLRKVTPIIKDSSPTSEQIVREKAANIAAQIVQANVNVKNLKHVDTEVKTGVVIEVKAD